MKNRVLVALVVTAGAAQASGFRGRAFERQANGGIGSPITGVQISLAPETGGAPFSVTTGTDGRYSLAVPAGRYYVIGTHAAFEDYSSAPGFAVASAGPALQTLNVFLRAPAVTTVIVVRHAEKLNPNSDLPAEPLSPAGQARAQRLKETLFRAGVTAVYSTDTVRTRETVRPLAEAFRLSTQTYSDAAEVAARILQDHLGDVVLVAAHSNTVGPIANALGAAVAAATIQDFDNLYLVSRAGTAANAVNLQYGGASTPDLTKNSTGATTFLLVGRTVSNTATEPQELTQTASKSGVAAIFTEGANSLVTPLATTLALTPSVFTPAQLASVVNGIITAAAPRVAMLAGSTTMIRSVVDQLGAKPVPIVYPNDRDHMIAVTRFSTGAARAVSFRF